jgi:hypothetical protein
LDHSTSPITTKTSGIPATSAYEIHASPHTLLTKIRSAVFSLRPNRFHLILSTADLQKVILL